jgi:hypothetical protein
MPFELSQVLRVKGMIDAVIAQAPADPYTATPALVDAYLNARAVCRGFVAGTDVEHEFDRLFPEFSPLHEHELGSNPLTVSARGDRARLLLTGLAGWLAAWPSAEVLLAELITALETAEAQTDEPEQKARLAGLLEGLRGAGRQIAVNVVSHYLERVHLGR